MSIDNFISIVDKLDKPRILELGTKRIDGLPSTLRKNLFTGYSEYLGLDMQAGEDVDIVGDIHQLSEVVGAESFDVIITAATFEHVKYPFLAAHQILKTLKIGGWLLIWVPQIWSIHSFPNDYFRYLPNGLAAMFGTKNGFNVVSAESVSKVDVFKAGTGEKAFGDDQTYITSTLTGNKTGKTPDNFIYEFENV